MAKVRKLTINCPTDRKRPVSAEQPVSWALVAPSVTPRRIHHNSANNPGLRLVKFDTETGAVKDYAQYYLDLAEANLRGQAEWTHEYNFTQYYQQEAVTADALHAVAHSMQNNVQLFKREHSHRLLTFNLHSPSYPPPHDSGVGPELWGFEGKLAEGAGPQAERPERYLDANSAKLPTSCNDGCYRDHYCAMTKIDYEEFSNCVSSAASALASANPSARRRPSPLLSPLLLLLLQLAAALQLLRPLPPPPRPAAPRRSRRPSARRRRAAPRRCAPSPPLAALGRRAPAAPAYNAPAAPPLPSPPRPSHVPNPGRAPPQPQARSDRRLQRRR
ncbi:Uncharacterized protein GBIM_03400 [Gryllus bimaculatus]|nr:Uncharacterized protein GBIM_03400 [Gryllus bimaculatus]